MWGRHEVAARGHLAAPQIYNQVTSSPTKEQERLPIAPTMLYTKQDSTNTNDDIYISGIAVTAAARTVTVTGR